jgi:hypothetical protein
MRTCEQTFDVLFEPAERDQLIHLLQRIRP